MLGKPLTDRHFSSSEAVHMWITQIYEGTNQVQRIVMARQLLNG